VTKNGNGSLPCDALHASGRGGDRMTIRRTTILTALDRHAAAAIFHGSATSTGAWSLMSAHVDVTIAEVIVCGYN